MPLCRLYRSLQKQYAKGATPPTSQGVALRWTGASERSRRGSECVLRWVLPQETDAKTSFHGPSVCATAAAPACLRDLYNLVRPRSNRRYDCEMEHALDVRSLHNEQLELYEQADKRGAIRCRLSAACCVATFMRKPTR